MPRSALIADFDGTLIRGDAFAEVLVGLALRSPLVVLRLLVATRGNLAKLKAAVAKIVPLEPRTLPWRSSVVAMLRREAETGRPVVLATATTAAWAGEAARHCGFFSHVLASDEVRNLKGIAKLEAIREGAFAADGFGYLGDSRADLPLFEAATAERIIVGGNRSVARSLQALGLEHVVLEQVRPEQRLLAVVRAVRPTHWLKNLLIFVPAFTSWGLYDPAKLPNALLAFVAFCFAASAVYLLNDMSDIAADRSHSEKRRRPLASGDLAVKDGVLAACVLSASAIGVSIAAGPSAFVGVVAYAFANIAYSSFLKEKPLLDIAALCFFYLLRVLVGVYVLDAEASVWFFGFLLCLFAELAFWKRYVESRASTTRGMKRRGYSRRDAGVLLAFGVGFSFSAALVLVLYLMSGKVSPVYASPVILVALAPLMLLHNLGMWLEASRGLGMADPVVRLLRSRQSWVVALVGLLIIVAARTLNLG